MEEGQGEPWTHHHSQHSVSNVSLQWHCWCLAVQAAGPPAPAPQAVMLHYPRTCTSSAGLTHVWIINPGMKSAPCQGPLKSVLHKVESKRIGLRGRTGFPAEMLAGGRNLGPGTVPEQHQKEALRGANRELLAQHMNRSWASRSCFFIPSLWGHNRFPTCAIALALAFNSPISSRLIF